MLHRIRTDASSWKLVAEAHTRTLALALALAQLQTHVVAEPVSSNPDPISPVADGEVASKAKLSLGEALFRDPRLSRDGVTSCA
jgi:cytochrome c peroxidase